MRGLMLGVCLVLASPAWAVGPVLNHCQFSWSEAVVPDGDLAYFTIKLATTPGGPYAVVGTYPAPDPAGGASYFPPTNYCAGQPDGQKYAVVTATDTAGNESEVSGEVPFVTNATAPPAASNLAVR